MKSHGSSNDPNKSQLLEQLYIQYKRLMYHVSFEILHDQYLAEDAVQAAFLKLAKNKFSIESVLCNKTKYFMVIIARNASFEIYNSKKRDNVVSEETLQRIPDESQTPLDNILRYESIQSAMKTIDTKYSDIVVMRYSYGYSLSEIATLFGISEQLVRVRLHRAKKMLIDKLNEEQSSYETI